MQAYVSLAKYQTLIPLILIAIASTGCGKGSAGSFVKGVEVKAYTQDGDAWGEILSQLNTGNVQLPSLNLPVTDPKDSSKQLGSLSLKSIMGGGTELGIAVNISRSIHTPGLDGGSLPNGSPIPVSGAGTPIGLPVGSGGSRVYVAFGQNTAMVGTALVIKEFDQVAKYAGGLDLFLPVKFKNGINAVAGVFTSPDRSKSGIAIFVDASSVLKKPEGTEFMSIMAGDLSHGLARDRALGVSRAVRFFERLPSARKMQNVQKGVNSLGRRIVTIE